MSVFIALGLAQYALITTRFNKRWVKYAFVTLDIAVVSVAIATQPPYPSAPDLPLVMNLGWMGAFLHSAGGIDGSLNWRAPELQRPRRYREPGGAARGALQGTWHLAAAICGNGKGAAWGGSHRGRGDRRARPG